MAARIIDGKAAAERVRDRVAVALGDLKAQGVRPGLATVMVGEDPASAVYVGGKQRACEAVGIVGFDHRLPSDASEDQVARLLDELNADPQVSGILLQLPVPAHLHGPSLSARIDPAKDVDGLTPVNAGRLALGEAGLRPATPLGVMELLAGERADLDGSEAVVVGRSNLFGKPMAQLLLAADATVTTCHSRTRNLAGVCARADVLIAAAGRPRLLGAEAVKPGALVVDVGMNRLQDRLVGDVDFEAVRDTAGAITPVPGGVGPMTIACLLENTVRAARALHATVPA